MSNSINSSSRFAVGLWIGAELPLLARLCIKSYLDHGFSFRLLVYQTVKGVPDGVELFDAAQILPANEVIRDTNGFLRQTIDRIRYRYLAKYGGFFTDLDNICLRPFEIAARPWFGLTRTDVASVATLSFPADHEAILLLSAYTDDPSTILPWDNDEQVKAKRQLAISSTSASERRARTLGIYDANAHLTRCLQHFDLFENAEPIQVFSPLHWSVWRHSFDGTYNLSSPIFKSSLTLHLFGSLVKQEPDALEQINEESIVAQLLERHGFPTGVVDDFLNQQKQPKIIVGICSCQKNNEKRVTVRETWLSNSATNVYPFFLVGKGSNVDQEFDTIEVDYPDGYYDLPGKVTEFLRHVYNHFEFDWVFKCDDDTYVVQDRLNQLVNPNASIIGNNFLTTRGSPSGGAGYFLRKDIVKALVNDSGLSKTGYEDIIIGEAAIRHGGVPQASTRLGWDMSRPPLLDNQQVTCHWCTPLQMRLIHKCFDQKIAGKFEVFHRYWTDIILLYDGGLFHRKRAHCFGQWTIEQSGALKLEWFQWGKEVVHPHPGGYFNDSMRLVEITTN